MVGADPAKRRNERTDHGREHAARDVPGIHCNRRRVGVDLLDFMEIRRKVCEYSTAHDGTQETERPLHHVGNRDKEHPHQRDETGGEHREAQDRRPPAQAIQEHGTLKAQTAVYEPTTL